MLLEDIQADVSSQLDDQSALGVQITRKNEVPEQGPTNRGVWFQVPGVTAVFADLKRSTELTAETRPKTSAFAYTHFVRAMAVILERFSAGFIDIQGDAVFGLFSEGSEFQAAAAAVTMRSLVETEVASQFGEDTSTDWVPKVGIGVDRGILLVRRLGLRGTKQNEVWAGKSVNMAAKLSSVAIGNQIVVSDRVFTRFRSASKLRKRVLLWSCGCDTGIEGDGLDADEGETTCLWVHEVVPEGIGLDFDEILRLNSPWCSTHGSEFCETLVTGKRPTE